MSVKQYSFDQQKRFVIENFDQANTFSSFLPGIAGVKGVPMWTFYVNRGQGICSFGVKDKHSPIMEFAPANIAYKTVATSGFRTFIKFKKDGAMYEPFRPVQDAPHIKRRMYIEANQVSIEEIHEEYGIRVFVQYFHMPEENFAGLVRKVSITNLNEEPLEVEVLDGLPEILPYGVTNEAYKEVGNLLRSWMEVYNLENHVPYYRVRASIGDEAEVSEVTSGHFYLSFTDEEALVSPIVDAALIFGSDTSLQHPEAFYTSDVKQLQQAKQITANKVPCGFTPVQKQIEAQETINICTIIGHVKSIDIIQAQVDRLVSLDFIEKKQQIALALVRELTNAIETTTSSELFDEYCRQSYLDNVLRGGYPYILENGKEGFVYHLFSRKHGDLERDYNFFTIAPEYYSQGNGNFRDANQNRRNDIYFSPQVGSFNAKMFMSLIQADGYNPLSVKGCSFEVRQEEKGGISALVEKHFQTHRDELVQMLEGKFTPGQLINFIENNNLSYKLEEKVFLTDVLQISKQNIEASFGEGYWIDHWTYNMDLIESYLDVYPEHMHQFLFEDKTYTFFDSPVMVQPRSEKYVLSKGKVRQYGAVVEDEEKMARQAIDIQDTNWLKTAHGNGDVYYTNLFAKLISLSLNKFATLDPAGIGVEMEANKPGWNDALNGLPGIFGSGVSETFELKRMVQFLLSVMSDNLEEDVRLPVEIAHLLTGVYQLLEKNSRGELSDFHYWDEVASLREDYRESIRFGIEGEEIIVSLQKIYKMYELFLHKIDTGIAKAEQLGNGLYPTYITFEVEEYEVVTDSTGKEILSHYGLPKVVVKKFKEPTPLPYFLEGPARAFKTLKDKEKAKDIYQAIKQTELYDKEIKMYKTSVSLEEESHEIGRIKAFTPGWLERESVFLHMTYKYLLALLKAELHEEYFDEMQDALIPFLDPSTYGRSTLENSSFIASACNPDPATHGRGFVARLSGSTAEFLSMWKIMMMGKKVFQVQEGQLTMTLSPVLPAWLFDAEGKVSFTFLGKTKVTYHNHNKKDTFGVDKAEVQSYQLFYQNGNEKVVEGRALQGEEARAVRDGEVTEIHVTLG
ncbi:cellobiose phosphorylase [Ectobacillus antri]|uniref:cellobiose phosphorylase n=1 Tax=Ectobacillus antri TaxID=2486280 RepID=UPI000F59D33A|nr:cellobiose phosphorylase [Ectobacillus antri]